MEKNTGIHKLFSFALGYKVFQHIISKPTSHKKFLEDYILKPKSKRFLDVGCGPADILSKLPGDICYIGVDYSKNYIENAKNNYGSTGEFYCMGVKELKNLKKEPFDMIYCNGLLHHLDDSEVTQLFSDLKPLLAEGGKIVTIDGCYIKDQNIIAKFLLNMDRGKNVRFQNEYEALVKPYFANVKTTILFKQLRLPYNHIIMEIS